MIAVPDERTEVDIFEIYALLTSLGLTAEYVGFRQAACAVRLSIQNPDRLCYASKWLYPDTAAVFRTTWRCVERNLRSAARRVWATNRETLSALAGYPLTQVPTASRFVAILALHLARIHHIEQTGQK